MSPVHSRHLGLTVSLLALAAAGLAASSQAGAQERLAPVTVTATGNPIESFTFPGQVSIVEREEIEQVMPSTVEEALRLVPGLDFAGGPRRTGQIPAIRGFSGPDVVILFDGVRQNFNSGHDGRFHIDPFLLRRVEVVKGPTSALYGSGGMGGTIEFRTIEAGDILKPGDGSGVRVGGGYATANGEDRYGVIGAARIGSTEGLAALTYRDTGDIDLGDGSTARNNERILSGLVKAGHRFGDGHDVRLSWQRFHNDATEPSNPQGVGSGGLVDKEVRNDTVRLGYGWRPSGSGWLDLGLTAGYARNQVEKEVLDGDGANPIGTRLDREVESYTLRLDNRSRLALGQSSRLTLTYGVEGLYDEQNGYSSSAPSRERDGVPDAEATTLAGFIQGEIDIDTAIGRVLVVPGLRFDHFDNNADGHSSVDASEFSPKLGLSYMPADWLNLFASYAHAFRAPSFDELYADGTHFTIGPIVNSFVANPDLDPQTSDTFEVGAGLMFSDLLTADDFLEIKGSYFYTKAENFIDLVVDQPAIVGECFAPPPFGIDCNGTTRADNVRDATLQGFEIEGVYDQRYVALRLGYAHIDGEDDDTGDALGSLQPDRLTALLTLKAPSIDSAVSWRSVIAGRLDRAAQGQERDAYTLHDVFLTYEPSEGLLDGLRLDLGVTNIFDEAYERTAPGAYEEGRSFRAGVSYTLLF